MKIFKIKFNKFDYDQYDSFVVVAETGREAIKLLKETYRDYRFGECNWSAGYETIEIKVAELKRSAIVLGSFNAG